MLTGNLVRLKFHKGRLRPQYLNAEDPQWLAAAEELIDLFRTAKDRTRGEIEAEVTDVIGDSPAALVQQGFAKLLDDRCEYETIADQPPDEVREAVFRTAAIHRAVMAAGGMPFNRLAALDDVAKQLNLPIERVDALLFADLKEEQRLIAFEDVSPERLLDRYNVALAQSILLKSVGVEIRIRGETPARYRQLFRAVRFRQLIANIRQESDGTFVIRIDGPLSLFSATQKYGLQLALLLPTLLHCKQFELKADIRWGAAKREMTFELSDSEGLRSPAADHGTFVPKEFALFAESFRSTISDWILTDDPQPIPLPDGVWVPDFVLTRKSTGQSVHLELFGYWRAVDVAKHLERLRKHQAGHFLLCVSEGLRADDGDSELPAGIVTYRRTPSAELVAKAAARLMK